MMKKYLFLLVCSFFAHLVTGTSTSLVVTSDFLRVEDMVGTSHNIGDVIKTAGFYTAGDGGGSTFIVRTDIDSSMIDNVFFVGLCNGVAVCIDNVINVRQSGATPCDTLDDSDALTRLSNYVNYRGGGVDIVGGNDEYLYGYQTPRSGYYTFNSEPAFDLKNCKNVRIFGGAYKLLDSLKYGAFDVDGNPILPFGRGSKKGAGVGYGIHLQGCENMVISGLELDGNADAYILGGDFQAPGYLESLSRGIQLTDSRQVEISMCHIHDYGTDGIVIKDNLFETVDGRRTNTIINACTFSGNRRWGVVVSRGGNIQFNACSFQDQGGGAWNRAPSGGIDIEGTLLDNVSVYQCNFTNNVGIGIAGGSGTTVQNLTVRECYFNGNTNVAAFTTCRILFENCFFYDELKCFGRAKVKNCYFSNEDAGRSFHTSSNYVTVEDCTFDVYRWSIEISVPTVVHDRTRVLRNVFNVYENESSRIVRGRGIEFSNNTINCMDQDGSKVQLYNSIEHSNIIDSCITYETY